MAKSKRSAGGKSTGRARPVSKRKSAAMRSASVPAKAGPSGDLIPVICADCFEDFAFDTGSGADALVCPVCENTVDRPDDATLHDIKKKTSAESSGFLLAFIMFVIAMASYGAFLYFLYNPTNFLDDNKFMGPMGGIGLGTLLLIILGAKYESNRWETYF